MGSDRRTDMVRSAAALMTSRGVSGITFVDVVAESGAARGSIYHYFPEGKQQLVAEAVEWTTERMLDAQRASPGGTPSEVLGKFIDIWRNVLASADGRSGCAVANAAIDTGDHGELLESIRAAFRSWVQLLADQLCQAGVPAERAPSIATAALAGMEGALILSRAEGDSGPLDDIAGELMRLLPPVAMRQLAGSESTGH